MGKGLRDGLGIAALLLLAMACDGGGGGGEQDGSAPRDGGGDARADGGGDAGSEPDAELDAQTDAEPDEAGGDGGAVAFSCASSGTEVTASAGGEVASQDGKLRLVLAPGALARDAIVHVCRVPNGQRPAEVQGDGPLSDVYFVEADAAFEGSLIFVGAPLPAANGASAFEPATLRHLALPDGAPANLADAILTLADSSRLSASLTENGFVYVRELDPQAQYSVQLAAPETSYVTGEVIALGVRVEAMGTPDVERSLAVEAVGCDLETIEPAGVAQTDGTSAECGVLTRVVREGNQVDGDEPLLVKDRVIDLTDADPAYPPPSFFCKFPGAGKASARLRLLNGAQAELSVVRELSVTCSYSGDLVSVYDAVLATRNGAAIELETTYGANFFVNFTPDARLASYQPLAADGSYHFDPADDSLTPNDGFVATATGNTLTIERQAGAPDPDFYAYEYLVPSPGAPAPTPPFYGAAGGSLAFAGPASIDCPIPSAAQLGVAFGAPAHHATSVAFNEGSIDALAVLALGSATGGALAVQRWIDPQQLPLETGKRTATLLTPAQFSGLPAGASFDGYVVNFFRVRWDESRAFWPAAGGRVVPIACGVSVGVGASIVEPP